MPKCAVCLPGLICIPSWECPEVPDYQKPIISDKNGIYYQENKERILDERRLHYQNNKERLKEARKRRLNK